MKLYLLVLFWFLVTMSVVVLHLTWLAWVLAFVLIAAVMLPAIVRLTHRTG